MKNRAFLTLLAVLLALLPVLGCAEGQGLEFDVAYQYMTAIQPVAGTNLLLMESKQDNSLGLFSTDGRELIPYGHAAINPLKNGFISAARDAEAVNGLAIYTQSGRAVSDYRYGRITVFDGRWVAGTVLEKAPEGQKDVTLKKVNYLIVRWDLYFVTEENAALVLSLNREQFAEAKQRGDLMAVKDRAGQITLYDPQGQGTIVDWTELSAPLYEMNKYDIVSTRTGETIASGYADVKETDLPIGLALVADVTQLDGTKASAILDAQGTVLMPADYAVVKIDYPYVVVADGEGRRGLYSLTEQRLLAPCQFSAIVTCQTSADPYVNNGYVCVETDGLRGFVDARTGEVTCPPAYNSRIAQCYGSSLVFDGERGFVLIAGDGTRTELFEYEEMPVSNGDGYLLAAKKNGFYGLIDWHGSEALPFIHKNVITLTDDSGAMIRTSTGLELDVITSR